MSEAAIIAAVRTLVDGVVNAARPVTITAGANAVNVALGGALNLYTQATLVPGTYRFLGDGTAGDMCKVLETALEAATAGPGVTWTVSLTGPESDVLTIWNSFEDASSISWDPASVPLFPGPSTLPYTVFGCDAADYAVPFSAPNDIPSLIGGWVKVHNGLRWVSQEQAFRALFVDSDLDVVHAWQVYRSGYSERVVGTGGFTYATHQIVISGFYGVGDGGTGTQSTSAAAWMTIVEAVVAKLALNKTLGGVAGVMWSQVAVPTETHRSFHGKLVHWVDVTLEVKERLVRAWES